MFYAAWITYICILFTLSAYVSKQANDSDSWKWVYILFFMNLFGAWPIVARYSKNLIFDSLLYDLIIFFTFYLTLLYLGAAKSFSPVQWVGTVIVAIGFIVLKLGEYIR